MGMTSMYQTWADLSLSFHHNYLGRSFSPSSLDTQPTVYFTENYFDNSVTIRIEADHDGRHYKLSENHYTVNAQQDREYFHRVVQRLADRLLIMILTDEIERWINLTP